MSVDTTAPVRVLVVEDNPIDTRAIQKSIDALLTMTQVVIVGDGDQAIAELANDPPPQLVLLDLNLPGRDGFDVLEHRRVHDTLRQVPVIVLTTSSSEADIRGAYERGANAFVTKPADLDGWKDLMTRIEKFWFTVVIFPPS